ncbi:MAG: hypothetical protein ABI702_03595 [Burkholderiales bacterium]
MSAAYRLEEPLEDVLIDLHVELGSCYTMKWAGKWPWLVKRGKFLFVDLLAAADYWEEKGKHHVAARLRERALDLHAKVGPSRALAARLREEAGQ